MILLLAWLVVINFLLVPAMLCVESAYQFAMGKPVDVPITLRYQMWKLKTPIYDVSSYFTMGSILDAAVWSWLMVDFCCGLLLLVLLAFFGYWLFIPIICGAVLCTLRYYNTKDKQDGR